MTSNENPAPDSQDLEHLAIEVSSAFADAYAEDHSFEREIMAEAHRRGIKGYFPVFGPGEANPAALAAWKQELQHYVPRVVEMVTKLQAKGLQEPLSSRDQRKLEAGEAWLRIFSP